MRGGPKRRWVRDLDVDTDVRSAWVLHLPDCRLEIWSFKRGEWLGKYYIDDEKHPSDELFDIGPRKVDAQRQIVDAALRYYEPICWALKEARP